MPLSGRLTPASRWMAQTSGTKRRHFVEYFCGTCNPLRMRRSDFCSTPTDYGSASYLMPRYARLSYQALQASAGGRNCMV